VFAVEGNNPLALNFCHPNSCHSNPCHPNSCHPNSGHPNSCHPEFPCQYSVGGIENALLSFGVHKLDKIKYSNSPE
jgi:hypothetical protein